MCHSCQSGPLGRYLRLFSESRWKSREAGTGATKMGVNICRLEPFGKRSPTKSPESWRTWDGGEEEGRHGACRLEVRGGTGMGDTVPTGLGGG